MIAWLTAPAPAERLAAFRILAGAFAVAYLVVRLPAFLAVADNEADRFAPVGLLAWLDGPWPAAAVRALALATPVAALAFAAGVAFRVSGPVFALTLLVLTTYRSSWGQLLWFENLLVLHVLVLAFSPSAAAWSIDARRRPAPGPGPSVAYGWPLRLAALLTVTTYVLAGVAKLRIGGLDWMLGDTLRNHVAYSAARLDLLGGTPSPLARLVVPHEWLFPPVAVMTVAIELLAPLALLGGRVRDIWVGLTWLMHLGIAALMFVVFPYPLFLVAFAPLYRLEHLAAVVRGVRARPAAHSRRGRTMPG